MRSRRHLALVLALVFVAMTPMAAGAARLSGLGDATVQYDADARACRDGMTLAFGSGASASEATGPVMLRLADGTVIFDGSIPLQATYLTTPQPTLEGTITPLLPRSATPTFPFTPELEPGQTVTLFDGAFGEENEQTTYTVQDCTLADERRPRRPGRPTVTSLAVVPDDECRYPDPLTCPLTSGVLVAFDLPAQPGTVYHAYVSTPESHLRPVHIAISTPNLLRPDAGADTMALYNLPQVTGSDGPYRVRIAVENGGGEGRKSRFSLPFTVTP